MGTLFRYEIKKLLARKLAWLLLAGCVALTALQWRPYIEEKFNGYLQGYRDAYGAYEGRVLNKALQKEAQASLDEYLVTHTGGSAGYTSGLRQGYSDIVNSFFNTEERQQFAEKLQKDMDAGHYSDGRPIPFLQKVVYRAWIAALSEPVAVHYLEGWNHLANYSDSIGIYCLFLLALGLAPLFSGERTAKMDSLLLTASKRGRATAAKLLAAACFAAGIFVLLFGLQLLLTALTFGLDGASVPSSTMFGWVNPAPGTSIARLFLTGFAAVLACTLATAALGALASSMLLRHPLASLLGFGGFIGIQVLLLNIATNEYLWGINLHNLPFGILIDLFITGMPSAALSKFNNVMMTAWNPYAVSMSLGLSTVAIGVAAWFAPRVFLKRRKA